MIGGYAIITTLLGLKYRELLISGISTLCFMFFLYFKTKKKSDSLTLRKKFPKVTREYEVEEVAYMVENSGRFPFNNLKITNDHELTYNHEEVINCEKIPASRKILFKRNIAINNGMGVKDQGSLEAQVRDSLGIFPFNVKFSFPEQKTTVYPKIELFEDVIPEGNPLSLYAGDFDFPFSGEGINFMGVREYRHGDPIKKLNWKITAKLDKAHLNEFEKNTNSKIALVLEFNQKIHYGHGVMSSWESLKDICLGIASARLDLGDEVELHTQSFSTMPGRGSNHINFLERRIFSEVPGEAKANWLQGLLSTFHRGTNVVFLCPLTPSKELLKSIDDIELFNETGGHVHVIFVKGLAVISSIIDPQYMPYLAGMIQKESEYETQLVDRLRKRGIFVHVENIHVRKGMMEKGFHEKNRPHPK